MCFKSRFRLARLPLLLGILLILAGGCETGLASPPGSSETGSPVAITPQLSGLWFRSPEPSAPAVIVFHGCGGLFRRDSPQLLPKFEHYRDVLNREGYSVLFTDSFGARGLGPVCGKAGTPGYLSAHQRAGDIAAAAAFLAGHMGVLPSKIALLGFSQGATALLEALDSSRHDAPAAAGAVLFYPACGRFLRQGNYRPAVPMLMLLGKDDNWTPEPPCRHLAERLSSQGFSVRSVSYEKAVHGFDYGRQPHPLPGIRSPMDGRPVVIGKDPASANASLEETLRFLLGITTGNR